MNTSMVSSQGTSLDEAIKLSSTYFDKGNKTSKLVIMISDGEDHSEGAAEAAAEANKNGMKIITIGVGTEKGGPIPIKENGVVQSFKRDNNNEVVITKLNPESLKEIAKETKGVTSMEAIRKKFWRTLRKRSTTSRKPNSRLLKC